MSEVGISESGWAIEPYIFVLQVISLKSYTFTITSLRQKILLFSEAHEYWLLERIIWRKTNENNVVDWTAQQRLMHAPRNDVLPVCQIIEEQTESGRQILAYST